MRIGSVLLITMLAAAQPMDGTAAATPADVASKQHPLNELPISERIKVPVGPGWLETGFGSLWVSKTNSKLVLRIDPATNRIVAKIPVGPDSELGIGVGLGSVWVPDTKDHSIRQIDPKTDKVVRTIPVKLSADPEGSIAVGYGSIWALTDEGGSDSGTLARIDAVSAQVTANIRVKPKSHAALAAFDSIWVTSSGAGSVIRIDPNSNAIVAEISVRAEPRFLAASDNGVWVLSQSDGTLARIDPSSNRVVATIDAGVPGEGGDLSVGETYVWVAAERVPLTQINPANNQLMRQFVGGRKDDTMRVGFGAAWVMDELHGQIWKIDLQKLAGPP